MLFYDVTTLYFETFEEDELRKNGFSKDNKSQQPQILVALMVTREGFPIAYEIFSGNTFEGHTIIPVVNGFIERNQVKEFTVVADAAMISADNIRELTKKLKFIQTKNQKVMLNEKLIDKTNKILGIKGYYTNLEETVAENKTIIERYHELYKIEQAFYV